MQLPVAKQHQVRSPQSSRRHTRTRLLEAAVKLFADKGFAATSTRDICEAADANVAAISYHFGDKAGLYTHAQQLSLESSEELIAAFSDPALDSQMAWRLFFRQMLQPLVDRDLKLDHRRLHLRGMLEWENFEPAAAQSLAAVYRPFHEALIELLRCQLGDEVVVSQRDPRADTDLHRLAFSIVSCGMFMILAERVVAEFARTVLCDDAALESTANALAAQAESMIAAERSRRRNASATPP